MEHHKTLFKLLLGAILSVGCSGLASAGQAAPSATEGVEILKLQSIDLAAEIEGLQDRQLRLRMLTLQPGGHIGLHSHEDRPAVAYVVQGTTTVTFGDGTVRRFSAGDSIAADRNTTHWHRNDEQEPAILVTADILHTAR